MVPPKGAPPPKGSQTISSFFQRIDRPASASQGLVASTNSNKASAGQRRPASPSSGAPAKRPRLTTPPSQSLDHWRYSRPAPAAAPSGSGTQDVEDVQVPPDTQPADPARHARFVKMLYASSRLDQQRNYGYLSNQTMERGAEGEASGSGSGSRSAYFPAKGGDEEVDGEDDDEFDDADSDEPEVVSSLSKFAHGNGNGTARASSSKGGKSGASSQSKTAAKGSARGKGKGKAKDDDAAGDGVVYTPLEKQILELKREYPGVLLIIEVGYKLKFYGDDARIASRELNIACFPEKHLLTAMIPVHRLHVHIRKLIAAGYKVGVVRQTETRALKAVSANKSQPFTRELTAMYTASTWVDDLDAGSGALAGSEAAMEGGLEEPTAQRSVVCVVERPEGGSGSDERVSIGLVSVAISTGDVIYDQFVDGNLRSELETRIAHLNPAELLLPDTKSKAALSKQTENLLKYITNQTLNKNGRSALRVERFSDPKLSQNEAANWLEEFYTRPSSAAASSGDDRSNGKGKAKSSARVGKGKRSGSAASDVIIIEDSDDENLESSPPPAPSTSPSTSQGTGAKALPIILKLPHLCLISLAHLIKHLSSFFSLTSVFSQPTNFTSFENRTTMLLTANTIHNLEIFQNSTDGRRKGSLIWLLDRCKTMMGRRLLRRWVARPLTDLTALQARVDAVEELGRPNASIGAKLASMLQGTPDLERGLAKLNYGALSPTELATFLLALNRITQEFTGVGNAFDVGTESSLVNESVAVLPSAKEIVQQALAAISVAEARKGNKKDLFVDPDMFPDIQDAKDNILVIESELREHLKEVRKQLKRPKLEYISVSGNDFLIEVRTADATKVPADWLRISATKSMVRFHTPQVRSLLRERDQHMEMLDAAADAAFKAFLETLKEDYVLLRNTVAALATLDALLSLVQVAQLPGYCKPIFNEENITRIEGLRHPMSEQLMESGFVPNDVVLGDEQSDFAEQRASTILLTGSNMGGKSSIARATALVSVLAQIGSFVPADSAFMPLHDAILTRMGASDMLAKGRSTFMVEVVETADIMRAATSKSLVIIDELGRGTSTYDGLAIAHAVLEYLVLGDEETEAKRPQMFFITHHFQLCELEAVPRFAGLIRNMHMAVLETAPSTQAGQANDGADEDLMDEDVVHISRGSTTSEPQIVFLYRLKPGPASKSLGINCARLAGLPTPVLEQAAKKSAEMEVVEQREVEGRRTGARVRMLRAVFGQSEGEALGLPQLESVKRALFP
ncbi:Mismatch repair protein msh3 [Tilletia horrida]|nr:Mismatch repair protein msh3 [Tilletia horrida]